MGALKLTVLILAWGGIIIVLGRGFSVNRLLLAVSNATGFAAGVAVGALLLSTLQGDASFAVAKAVLSALFLLHWLVSLAALYRSTGEGTTVERFQKMSNNPLSAACCSIAVGILAGTICSFRFIPQGGEVPLLTVVIVGFSGVCLTAFFFGVEQFVPKMPVPTAEVLMAIVVSFILFASSSIPRLDLFSPLVMKVMKLIHDIVHQFFESMLIPDHLFFRPEVWNYIGLLFGNRVGLWGGMLIWFTPVLLVAAAIRLERLPSVAHIRQGAERRTLLKAHIRERRTRLVAPLIAGVMLAAAVFQSRFPAVEYWDPKPLKVAATPSGSIFIPLTGEIDLKDGKIHKFLFKERGRDARFMVLQNSAGGYTVTLDACSICKPDGYGQTEGAVICYYCKTLIPLETVGKPGGCNPVPVPFMMEKNGIAIDGAALLNLWGITVQATNRVKGAAR